MPVTQIRLKINQYSASMHNYTAVLFCAEEMKLVSENLLRQTTVLISHYARLH